MLPAIYPRKARADRAIGEVDLPVEVNTVELSEIMGDEVGGDEQKGSGGGAKSVITEPIPLVTGPDGEAILDQEEPNTRQRKPNTMNLRQITADRPIFTLSVAADLLGLHPRTLRIYEEKGLVVPARTEGNRRRYSQIDIAKFQAIRLLTRGGVNLEGVRIILDMADELTRLGSDPTAIIERNLQTGVRD